MIQWIQIHEVGLLWLTAISVLTFVGSLIVVPFLVVRIPADYFARKEEHGKSWANYHPVVRGMLLTGKNLLGYALIAAGLVMLVLPGQGMLTILIGILLVDFPGKYRLERWVVTRGPVLQSINWLRQRAGRAQLVLGRDDASKGSG
jgi:hypothetical protein